MSGMSIETRKMDSRGSAECQNWENKDIIGNLKFDLNEENAKKGIVPSLASKRKQKNVKMGKKNLQ